MTHMPQAALLRPILPLMIRALLSWRSNKHTLPSQFQDILAALRQGGLRGEFWHKAGDGSWHGGTFEKEDLALQKRRAMMKLENGPTYPQPDRNMILTDRNMVSGVEG